MIDLKRLRELEAKATKGPWTTCEGGKRTVHISQEKGNNICHPIAESPIENYSEEWLVQENADADFIVELRNALPELMDRLEAAEKCVRCAQAQFGKNMNPAFFEDYGAWRKAAGK